MTLDDRAVMRNATQYLEDRGLLRVTSGLDPPKCEVRFASINGQYRGGIVDRLFSLIRRCVLIPTPRLKERLIVNLRTDSSIPVILIGCQSNVLIRVGADESIVLLLPMFRATSMSSGVSNALSIILTEAISKARSPHSSTNGCPTRFPVAAPLGRARYRVVDEQGCARLEGVN